MRCIEQNVEWATGLMRVMRDRSLHRFEATAEAEWSRHAEELAEGLLHAEVES